MPANSFYDITVPLVSKTTRQNFVILTPPSDVEYNHSALLRAKTLLAFYNKVYWLDVTHLPGFGCDIISTMVSENVSKFEALSPDDVISVINMVTELRSNDYSAILPVNLYAQRHEQPGIAVVKTADRMTFLNMFLGTSEKWLNSNTKVIEQLRTLCPMNKGAVGKPRGSVRSTDLKSLCFAGQ